MEERIDIYDEDERPTGRTMARKGSFLHEGEYMLYVLAIIEDASGRYLITQRARDKRWAAGWWEVTGGGVMAGETSAAAVVREVREETGLDVSAGPLAPVWRYRNVDLARGDNYIVDIYHFRLDFDVADVRLQQREAIGCRLATRAQVDELARQGVFLHYDRLRQALAAEAEGAPAPAPLDAPPAPSARL
ncbi:MAG: NUDIX hydrolase [Parafannyhessea umbonata]|nr:NUDIX hydrolase [Parafannyhessea umbonata]MDD6358954.1 NUDIX hydrolase [Parafannyhessea umbonata]